jgi:hypothetical protein
MATMITTRGEAFTPADLETMPDDGHRYELIDGALIVTPGTEQSSPDGQPRARRAIPPGLPGRAEVAGGSVRCRAW